MIAVCKKCPTKHHTQDDLHGKGRRVINEHKTKNGTVIQRCTVCGHERITLSAKPEAKET